MKKYQYFINLDERGEFYADVRDKKGNTKFEIHNLDGMIEDGYMKHKKDLNGLKEYLVAFGVMKNDDRLKLG